GRRAAAPPEGTVTAPPPGRGGPPAPPFPPRSGRGAECLSNRPPHPLRDALQVEHEVPEGTVDVPQHAARLPMSQMYRLPPRRDEQARQRFPAALDLPDVTADPT